MGWSWDIEQANAMEMEFVVEPSGEAPEKGNLTQLIRSFLSFALVPSSFFRPWEKGQKNCRHFSPDTQSHQGNTSNHTSHYVRKKQAPVLFKPLFWVFCFTAKLNPREICTNTVTRITLRTYLHKRMALLAHMDFIKF